MINVANIVESIRLHAKKPSINDVLIYYVTHQKETPKSVEDNEWGWQEDAPRRKSTVSYTRDEAGKWESTEHDDLPF